MKMFSVKYSQVLKSLMNKQVDIYAANSSNVSSQRAILAQQFSTISEWILKIGFSLYTLAGMFYLLNPLYSYFWLDKIVPLIPIYMPFIDENTQIGFVVLTLMHLQFMILTLVASAAVDFMFIILIFNMLFLAKLFTNDVDELNDTLREEKVDKVVAKAKLLNILLMHQEIFE